MPQNKPKKILIVKLSSIGDVLHTIPCLMALRKNFPNAQIDWIVEELSFNLIEGHPALNNIYKIPKKRWRANFFNLFQNEISPFIKEIRSQKYDVAIDFQGLTKSGLIAYLSGAKTRIGFGDKDGREINKIFTNKKVYLPQNLHIVEKNLYLLTALGINEKNPEFKIPITDEDRKFINDWMNSEKLEKGFIILNPGAGWITKRLPPERFIELAIKIKNELNKEIVLTWGPGEEELVKNMQEEINKKAGKIYIPPRTTLRQYCALAEQSIAFIGGDTGPMHLAAAMKVPIVSFFGASDAKRNQPYCEKKYVIQLNEIECVPCWKKQCPRQDIKCMNDINIDQLFDGLKKIIE